MLTNLLIPGAANFQRFAADLHGLGVLNLFVYSHRLSTTARSIGLPEDRALNLPLKEYLIRGHLMLMGWKFSDALIPIYLDIWERGVLRHWRIAPIVHALLWGGSRRVLKRARQEGAVTLGLPANSHPELYVELLAQEADRIGVYHKRAMTRLHRRILEEVELCDHLHAESNFVKESYATRGYPRDRIHVVRPGKDLSRLRPLTDGERRRSDGRFRVICVGAISLRKGQIHLLKAWRRLRFPDAELVLVGGMDAQVSSIVRGYADEFKYIGRVQEMRDCLVRASVMVAPSIEDGHGHVIGEALACGIPVITTPNTGAADYIEDGFNGFIVPIASSEAIAERLEALYRDRTLLEKLTEGARATIPVVGSWKDYALRLSRLYREITAEREPTFIGSDQTPRLADITL